MASKTIQNTLSIDYPIVQAPMAGNIVSPDLVAQVCNFGFLGSIPSGFLSIEKTRDFIEQVQSKTDRAFQLNIFVDYDSYGDSPLKKPAEVFELEKNYSGDALPEFTIPSTPTIDEFIQVAIDCQVPIISTTFGLLSDVHVNKLKSNHIKIMNNVNSVYELEIALKTQAPDVLIYQNAQAGGHKCGFTQIPHSDSAEIIKALQDYPDVPCIVAGGIVNKSDVNNALNQGFDGVQIGSAFIATEESPASNMHKKYMLSHTGSIFTDSVSGRQARGLENKMTSFYLKDNIGFPYLFHATASLRKKAKDNNDMEYQAFWCGDGIDKINKISKLQDYMESLI